MAQTMESAFTGTNNVNGSTFWMVRSMVLKLYWLLLKIQEETSGSVDMVSVFMLSIREQARCKRWKNGKPVRTKVWPPITFMLFMRKVIIFG